MYALCLLHIISLTNRYAYHPRMLRTRLRNCLVISFVCGQPPAGARQQGDPHGRGGGYTHTAARPAKVCVVRDSPVGSPSLPPHIPPTPPPAAGSAPSEGGVPLPCSQPMAAGKAGLGALGKAPAILHSPAKSYGRSGARAPPSLAAVGIGSDMPLYPSPRASVAATVFNATTTTH